MAKNKRQKKLAYWLSVAIDEETDALLDSIKEAENDNPKATGHTSRATLTRKALAVFIHQWKEKQSA